MPDSRPLFAGRLRPAHLLALDVLAALVVLVFLIGNLVVNTAAPDTPGGPVAAVGLAVAVTVPIAIRRLSPPLVFLAGMAVLLALLWLGGVWSGLAAVAAAYEFYLVASTVPRRRSLILLACALAVVLVQPNGVQPVLFCWAALALAWVTGTTAGERRTFQIQAAEGRARQAVTDERMRIARELHDVVAHNMSLIAVKAGVANHLAAQHPEETRDALRVIEATSREALVEMRRLLGVLRNGGEPESAPAPDLTGLPDLVRRAAAAGVRIDLEMRGVEGLPDAVGLSAYRIVQESVTNMVKHAAPADARITVVADNRELVIEATDDGPGSRQLPGPEGHGLIGMRERVATYGGEFTAGPRPDGGFAVQARIPLDGVVVSR